MAEIKRLGSLEERILAYLVMNPGQFKEKIQRGLNYRESSYAAIYRAANSLKEGEYIEAKVIKSKKEKDIEIYYPTEFGINYLLLTIDVDNPETEALCLKLLEKISNNKPKNEAERFQIIQKELGISLTIKYVRSLFGNITDGAFSINNAIKTMNTLTPEENQKIEEALINLATRPIFLRGLSPFLKNNKILQAYIKQTGVKKETLLNTINELFKEET